MAKLCAWNLVEETIENSLNKKQYASVVWCAREDLFSLFMNEYTRPKWGLVWVLVYVCVWKCFGEFIIAGATVKARNILNNNIEIVVKVRALASFALKFVT